MTTYTQRRRQRGATLIEVLTVVFILGLISLSLAVVNLFRRGRVR